MIEVSQVQQLQVHPLHTAAANGPRRSTISGGVPTSGELERISASSRPMAAARRAARRRHARRRAQTRQNTSSSPGNGQPSRPRRHPLVLACTVSSLANGTLNSSAKVAASAGVRLAPSRR
ncbi:luciferase-like monooxygenase domain protein [Mycobacterium xenopi 3993]|nr:luciferase-like monooxygenase domain protein [Mycobacterium xenopi 3993]